MATAFDVLQFYPPNFNNQGNKASKIGVVLFLEAGLIEDGM